MGKRLFSMLLVLAIGLFLFPGLHQNAAAETGDYVINSAARLHQFAEQVNGGDSFRERTVTLVADIDLGRVDWIPVGSSENPFRGVFDGGGHSISGLKVNETEGPAGLFGCVREGTVRNINVSGTVSGLTNAGGVIGECDTGTVENCVSHVSVSGESYVGGVVGYSSGLVKGCTGNAEAVGSDSHVGGVVGYNDKGLVDGCMGNGSVSGSASVGGVVGKNEGGTLLNCMSGENAVVDGSTHVGGIVGYNAGVALNCMSDGTVSGDWAVGGFSGFNNETGIVRNCYNIGAVNGSFFAEGIVGYGVGVTADCYYRSESGEEHASEGSTAMDEDAMRAAGGEAALLTRLNRYVAHYTGEFTLETWESDEETGFPIFAYGQSEIQSGERNDILPEAAEHGRISVNSRRGKSGSTITITAEADEGYLVKSVAVWSGSGSLALTESEEGVYSFVMPEEAVTVTAVFAEENPFGDVAKDSYYYAPVLWAIKEEITFGMDAEHFDPDGTTTRAQMVTFLWRAAGKPAAEGSMGFADVSADAWYAEAVRWAVAEGITKGVTETTFCPDMAVNRGQAVTFLYRYAGLSDAEEAEPAEDGCGFEDVPKGKYYYAPVLWAVEHHITNGMTETAFSPNESCTRAQAVTFLYREMVG